MTVESQQFWSLLAESKLTSPTQVQALFSEFNADSSLPKRADAMAQWIVQKGQLTPYQAKILLAGQPGPFSFGPYVVQRKLENGPLSGSFLARHRRVATPVLLHFLSGESDADLQRWKTLEQWAESRQSLQTGTLTPIYDVFRLPEYRFVVSGVPDGKSVSELPAKSRLNWKQAAFVVAQVADGLSALHKNGLMHGSLSERAVWIDNSGKSQLFPHGQSLATAGQSSDALDASTLAAWQTNLAPEIQSPEELTPQAEIYSLGCLLVRLISGRPFCRADEPEEKKKFHRAGHKPQLQKYEVPPELLNLLEQTLAVKPERRPETAHEVAQLLALHAGKAKSMAARSEPSELQQAFRKQLAIMVPAATVADVAPTIETGEPDDRIAVSEVEPFSLQTESASANSSLDLESIRRRRAQRKKQKWMIPVAIAASILLFAGALVAIALVLSQTGDRPVAKRDSREGVGNPPIDPINGQPEVVKTKAASAAVVQTLIEDDDVSLWETPTLGGPIDFAWLPPVPKSLLHWRTAELLADPEGERLLQSFGPQFEGQVRAYFQRFGVQLGEAEQILVSFHEFETATESGYRPYSVITLNEPLQLDQLLDRWDRPGMQETESGQRFYRKADGLALFPIPNPASISAPVEPQADRSANEATAPVPTDFIQFAVGPEDLMRQALALPGGVPLTGTLEDLATVTDRRRHVTFLYLRPALFNDQGQAWMGEQLGALNRQLSVMLPDEVKGGLLSFHLDQGNYLELRFDRIVDLSAGELQDYLKKEFRSRREQLTEFVATIAPNPYWDRVRVQYTAMLVDLFRNLRFGVERGDLVVNAWLPPMAAHNLIAASELVTAFSSGAAVSQAPGRDVPQSLQALLQQPRDLNIANPPDLNVLMSELKQEIESDYGKLPFQWEIKLIGSDLEKEGITKNQRPGELVIQQKSLADILTMIMVSANPSKDITGPEDPECKLVWVVAEDPDQPGQMSILITTRKAATDKSYTLPPAFQQ